MPTPIKQVLPYNNGLVVDSLRARELERQRDLRCSYVGKDPNRKPEKPWYYRQSVNILTGERGPKVYFQ